MNGLKRMTPAGSTFCSRDSKRIALFDLTNTPGSIPAATITRVPSSPDVIIVGSSPPQQQPTRAQTPQNTRREENPFLRYLNDPVPVTVSPAAPQTIAVPSTSAAIIVAPTPQSSPPKSNPGPTITVAPSPPPSQPMRPPNAIVVLPPPQQRSQTCVVISHSQSSQSQNSQSSQSQSQSQPQRVVKSTSCPQVVVVPASRVVSPAVQTVAWKLNPMNHSPAPIAPIAVPSSAVPSVAPAPSTVRVNGSQGADEKRKKCLRDWVVEWGLPGIVGDIYARRGIKEFYDWQLKCLCNERLVGGRNLVYTLPTSSGKTLVAEIALLRCLVLQRRMAILVLPFVSIVVEKTRAFEALASKLDFVVEAYYGSQGTTPVPPGARLVIGTIEKVNGIVNSLVEEKRIAELGCVVVDEVHMVSDRDRGATLELLLSKLIHVSSIPANACALTIPNPSGGALAVPSANINALQIIAMSATVPNVSLLGKWMRAETFEHAFRPVPLKEHVKMGDRILDSSGKELRRLKCMRQDFDGVVALCAEVVPSHSVLVFCSTKSSAETGATHIAKLLPEYLKGAPEHPDEARRITERGLLLQKLAACSAGSGCTDDVLRTTIPRGVAYHSTGLTTEERELIEEAFRQRVVSVLCCTSTLAAGVNLPARRVVIRSPHIGAEFMSPKYYKQMTGRAGRAGYDEFGESFLILDERKNGKDGMKLVHADTERITSQLLEKDAKGLERLILEGTCGGYAQTRSEIVHLVDCTLAAADGGVDGIAKRVDGITDSLVANGFVERKKRQVDGGAEGSGNGETAYVATPLGDATYHSCFSPEEAKIVYSDLERARRCFVLTDELHMCYLSAPLFNLLQPNWGVMLGCINVPEDDSRSLVFGAIGGARSVVEAHASSSKVASDPSMDRALARFYNALMLRELIGEGNLTDVARKYCQARGAVQGLMQSASAFAGMTVSFCKRLGWSGLEVLLASFVKRLNHGVQAEVLPLTEIKGVGRSRARALYNAGFRTANAVASAKPEDIVKHVKSLGPFKERAAKVIIRGAKELLERQAKDLQRQADEMIATAKKRRTATAPTTGTPPVAAATLMAAASTATGNTTAIAAQETVPNEGNDDDLMVIDDEAFPAV